MAAFRHVSTSFTPRLTRLPAQSPPVSIPFRQIPISPVILSPRFRACFQGLFAHFVQAVIIPFCPYFSHRAPGLHRSWFWTRHPLKRRRPRRVDPRARPDCGAGRIPRALGAERTRFTTHRRRPPVIEVCARTPPLWHSNDAREPFVESSLHVANRHANPIRAQNPEDKRR